MFAVGAMVGGVFTLSGTAIDEAAVKRGKRLRASCNFAGKLALKFKRKGARARTLTATVGSNGRTKIRTKRLSKGKYRVAMKSVEAGIPVGKDRVRIR